MEITDATWTDDINTITVRNETAKEEVIVGTKMYKTVQLLLVIIHRTILLAVVLIAGALIYAEIEDKSHENSSFFCWTVVTTIGYGAEIPTTNWGKVFTMIYALIGIPVSVFCLAGYGSFLNHSLKKMIVAIETCCCKRSQVSYIHAKLLVALIILALGELFICSYAMCLMYGWSYFDSVYAWFITVSTIGFGDFIPAYPPEKSVPNSIVSFVINLFSLATIASIIEAIHDMLSSVNNNKRGICAILFCCYNNDDREFYGMQRNSSSTFGLDYVKD